MSDLSLDRESITLDAIDTKGKPVRAKINATIIKIKKQEVEAPDKDVASSKSKENEEIGWQSSVGDVISPQHDPVNLAVTYERSSDLQQLIRAMVTNIVGFGWQLKEKSFPEGFKKEHLDEIEAEKFRLTAKLDSVHATKELTELRALSVTDKHITGNGYLELIESVSGELVGINHIKSYLIRMTKQDDIPTKVLVPRIRPDKKFMIEEVPMYYRFRRYVLNCNGKKIWFKEAGDPRQLNCETGEYAKEDEKLDFPLRATSLIHSLIYTPITSYGAPLWIGNTLSVLGGREAEELNYETLLNNAIPAMIVVVENGALTEGSVERLQEWTELHVQGSKNYSKFLILEGETSEDANPTPGSFRIRIEPLKNVQQKDELFQEYGKNNSNKVRQAFRLPPIFVGDAERYNRATADTSRDVADEQVFAPERNKEDYLINRFVLSRWDNKYHEFKSNHPNITDDIELIRLMAIAERSGGMTPRRADKIIRDVFGDGIGPLPEGVDIDKPFSISFAEAQKGKALMSGGDPGKSVIDSLVSMSKSIDDEIDRRIYDIDDDE